jgi:Uma2 family endonuclease
MSPAIPGEERFILRNVSWQTYASLLKDYEDQSAPGFTYDRGTLEIMRPLVRHERANRDLAQIVEMICEGWEIDVVSAGSTTFKREDIDRGFEPDSCFYIQHAETVADAEEIDLLGGDSAPDLVIEVDLTSSSVPKLPIFAAFGVPEVWQYVGEQVTILVLNEGAYGERDASLALPPLSTATLNDFIRQSRSLRRVAWLRAVREWARQNAASRHT